MYSIGSDQWLSPLTFANLFAVLWQFYKFVMLRNEFYKKCVVPGHQHLELKQKLAKSNGFILVYYVYLEIACKKMN